VHFALSSCTGGAGGNGLNGGCGFCVPVNGGNGGDAIYAWNLHPEVIIAGRSTDVIRGGYGGLGSSGGSNGWGGFGLRNYTAVAWLSGATIQLIYTASGAATIHVQPDDPTLELTGTPTPGGSATLTLRSEPGTIARLILGRTPIVMPTPGVRIEQLETRDRSLFLGVVPASGELVHVLNVPSFFATGELLIAQGRLVFPAQGEVRRTNSVALVVR
jgi:hypothetical protein